MIWYGDQGPIDDGMVGSDESGWRYVPYELGGGRGRAACCGCGENLDVLVGEGPVCWGCKRHGNPEPIGWVDMHEMALAMTLGLLSGRMGLMTKIERQAILAKAWQEVCHAGYLEAKAKGKLPSGLIPSDALDATQTELVEFLFGTEESSRRRIPVLLSLMQLLYEDDSELLLEQAMMVLKGRNEILYLTTLKRTEEIIAGMKDASQEEVKA